MLHSLQYPYQAKFLYYPLKFAPQIHVWAVEVLQMKVLHLGCLFGVNLVVPHFYIAHLLLGHLQQFPHPEGNQIKLGVGNAKPCAVFRIFSDILLSCSLPEQEVNGDWGEKFPIHF